jgi:uncharacterized protein with ParB-like and HNH nuclease domain
MNTKVVSTIVEILDKKIFRIPDYQRGYSWGKSNLEDLWSDIEMIKDDKVHYMGTLSFQELKPNELERWSSERPGIQVTKGGFHIKTESGYFSSNVPYYIVDGQQRMTTILILVREIYSVLALKQQLPETASLLSEISNFICIKTSNNLPNIARFCYESGSIDSKSLSDYFEDMDIPNSVGLAGNTSGKQEEDESSIYSVNLKAAKEFFKAKLDTMREKAILEVWEKIQRNLWFNIFLIPKELNIFTVFETMNFRGKPLSILELLKNRLINITYSDNELNEEEKTNFRSKIHAKWKSIYQQLGKKSKKNLLDDDYLKIHWLMYFDHSQKKLSQFNDMKADLLDGIFSQKNNSPYLVSEELMKYVDDLEKNVKYFVKWRCPSIEIQEEEEEALPIDSVEHNDNILSISVFQAEEQNLDAPKQTSGFEDLDLQYLIGSISRLAPSGYFDALVVSILSKNEDNLEFLLKRIERYCFLMFSLAEYKANTNKVHFLKAANFYYVKGNYATEVILSTISIGQRKLRAPFLDDKISLPNYSEIIERFESNRLRDRTGSGYLSWKHLVFFLKEYYIFRGLAASSGLRDEDLEVALIFPLPLAQAKLNSLTREFVTWYIHKRGENFPEATLSVSIETQYSMALSLGNIVLMEKRNPVPKEFIEKWFSTPNISKYLEAKKELKPFTNSPDKKVMDWILNKIGITKEKFKQLEKEYNETIALIRRVEDLMWQHDWRSFKEKSSMDCYKLSLVETENEWNLEAIYLRGLSILNFLERRWEFTIDEKAKKRLLYLSGHSLGNKPVDSSGVDLFSADIQSQEVEIEDDDSEI